MLSYVSHDKIPSANFPVIHIKQLFKQIHSVCKNNQSFVGRFQNEDTVFMCRSHKNNYIHKKDNDRKIDTKMAQSVAKM